MSSNPCNYMDYRGWRPLNGRPGWRIAVCFQVKVRGRRLDGSAYGLHARSVCDTKAPLQLHLRLGAPYQCYVPLHCGGTFFVVCGNSSSVWRALLLCLRVWMTSLRLCEYIVLTAES